VAATRARKHLSLEKVAGLWEAAERMGVYRVAEEVTDPAEIALMEEYESTRFTPDYYSRPPFPLLSELDPQLCPRPWRRGDRSCATR